jgi:hypothetical protein
MTGNKNEKTPSFSFLFLNKFLSENGIYVIEDIQPNSIDKFLDLTIFPKEEIITIKKILKLNILISVLQITELIKKKN